MQSIPRAQTVSSPTTDKATAPTSTDITPPPTAQRRGMAWGTAMASMKMGAMEAATVSPLRIQKRLSRKSSERSNCAVEVRTIHPPLSINAAARRPDLKRSQQLSQHSAPRKTRTIQTSGFRTKWRMR